MKHLPLIIALLASVLIASCSKDNNTNSNSYTVQYNIGCSDCMVIYVSDTAGTQTTEYHQNSDWSYTFEGKRGQEVLVLAYNTSSAPQGVNVRIAVNDSITKDRTTYCPINGVSLASDTL